MEIVNIIAALIFLFTLLALGVYLYFRFHAVQKRVLHKDEYYDKPFEEFYTKRKQLVRKPRFSSLLIKRLIILYSTFIGVIALFLLGKGVMQGEVIQAFEPILLSIVYSPFILLIFPIGIDMFFNQTSQGGIIGYILYLLILWFASTFEENRSFTFIYIIFVILLIINIVGCSNTDLSGLS